MWKYDVEKVGSWVAARKRLLDVYSEDDPIKIMDVGAHQGDFLKALPAAWIKHAIEPSYDAREKLKRNGIEHRADFLNATTAQELQHEFDVITLFDVFEHLPSLSTSLDELMTMLKPDGRLYISTGNADHWTWRLLRGHHWYLHSAQHLSFGGVAFFRKVCNDRGWNLDALIHHSHQVSSGTERFHQSIKHLYYWARSLQNPVAGFVARTMCHVPGLKYLRHEIAVPHGTSLADHILVVLRPSRKCR
ncbi:bifunctional 3-demethylubiquinone-9 3-methyltransferase/ 2-octaprenyl-6-hydroxy phenol methylase [Stieleria varia]|uniref:Bifunctional 3-demethylubiquinone-9 3-methyltransferase/ 2-octaprenyl-6-hydroxy phenol methylase n=2 Tax=Stieleria varia TaxID=2528005 RepID=A0A5C6B0Y6_9BACT|nr:bifunctional 3-demethylubiquinone-9 3-methyltransferase/ 2-octaprenyl-6-hydroxy phenol methylase [Stieleria varia]